MLKTECFLAKEEINLALFVMKRTNFFHGEDASLKVLRSDNFWQDFLIK